MATIRALNKFTGYKNFSDITNTPSSNLVAGSLNTFIPDGEKLEPRAGMGYLGATGTDGSVTVSWWTLPHRIHSKYDEFVNKGGYTVPIRVYYSGGAVSGIRDVMQAYLPVFSAGVATTTKKWYDITNPNQTLTSNHRYYFAEWFDGLPSAQQSLLVFTTGISSVYSWTGGFAPIISKTLNTLTTSTNWSALGFNLANGGSQIVINGSIFDVTSTFDSPTITVTQATTSVNINDVVFQGITQKTFTVTPPKQATIFDVCATINNQVYYLDWNQRNVFISWNRNQDASTVVTDSAILADLTASGNYNGSVGQTIKVKIDSVIEPPVRTFSAAVAGDQDNIIFTGTHTGSNRDTIQVVQNGAGPTFFYDIKLNGATVATSIPLLTPYAVGSTGISVQASYGYFPTPNQDGDTWTLIIGGADTYTWYVGNTNQGSGIPVTTNIVNSGVTYSFTYPNGHALGDSWTIFNSQEILFGWTNFTFDAPDRLPGQGFTALLDSNGWTMIPQESTMYINDASGRYYTVNIRLSADLLSESVVITRLKSEPQNKVLFPYLIKYIKNQMTIISQEKTFDILGRQKFLELPQMKSISDEVRIDFETADWQDGDVLYYKRKLYFCVPRTGLVFVYDDYKKYWHAPMEFGRRISLLSIIDDMLVGHSYERNESYELFTGLNDLGIFPIKTRMVFPYESFGSRYSEKYCSAIGFEGYIVGNPDISYTINSGLGGCNDQIVGKILPQNTPLGICVPMDTASLGKSSLGYHGLGNSPSAITPHFFYIKQFDNMMFYQRNIEIESNSLDQRWSLISLGTDVADAAINNESITDTSPL